MNRGYYRRIYGGHLWPEWYRKEARRRGNTALAKCCAECQREVEGWKKPRPAEAR